MNIVLATLAMALSAATPTTEPPTTTPASEEPTTTAAPSTAPPTTAPIPEGYVPLVDDTDSIVIAVPEAWTDVDTAPKGATQRPYIAASPNLESFLASLTHPACSTPPSRSPPTRCPLSRTVRTPARVRLFFEVKTYDDQFFVGAVQIGEKSAGPTP